MAPVCGKITLPKQIYQYKKGNKWTKLDYSIRSTRIRINSGGKIWTDIFINSGLTRETRASVTLENVFQEGKEIKNH